MATGQKKLIDNYLGVESRSGWRMLNGSGIVPNE